MKLFRLVILLWLSLSVPTAALASVVSADHCQRGKPAAASVRSQHAMHAGMAMQGEHAQHLMHAGQLNADKGHCSCGCNCSGTHCATACSAVMAGAAMGGAFTLRRDFRLIAAAPTHPVAAHHLDLLRPPSLI